MFHKNLSIRCKQVKNWTQLDFAMSSLGLGLAVHEKMLLEFPVIQGSWQTVKLLLSFLNEMQSISWMWELSEIAYTGRYLATICVLIIPIFVSDLR